MRSCRNAFVLFALLTLATAPDSALAWTRDASTNEPTCVAADGQNFANAATDAAGNIFVAWHDNRSGNFDVYLQKYDSKGAAQWAVNGVAAYVNASTQTYPQVVADGAGGAIVLWTDLRNGTFDIYAQRLNSVGSVMWPTGGVPVCVATGNQWHLEVVPDGSGGALATWTDFRGGGNSDVYAQRVDPSGNRLWTTNGVAIATTANTEEFPQVVADGSGGAILTWQGWGNSCAVQRLNASGVPQWGAGVSLAFDGGVPWTPRLATDGAGGAIVAWMTTGNDVNEGVRVQRFNSAGAPQWIAGGRRLTQYIFGILPTYTYLDITSDGAGGAFVAWADERTGSADGNVYAQKVDASGATKWTTYGVPVCTATGDQEGYYHPVVPDGLGGCFVAWHDPRNGANRVYAQRISVGGVAQWTANGLQVAAVNAEQAEPSMVFDARGGAVIAWHDLRTGNYDIYTQRLDLFGNYGDPSPSVVSVKDVPNDQGERVRIKWNASYRDTTPTLNVGTYGIWRQVTESAAAVAIARGARVHAAGGVVEVGRGTIRAERTAAQTTWWEGVGSIPARGEAWYTFVAETFQDSTSTGNPLTTFMVDAHDANVPAFWTSFSATGYSVDNIPPAVPGGFALSPQGGAVQLSWDANLENDLAAYRVYRGTTGDFVPSPANRIATVSTTGYSDPSPGGVYKLSAVDIHGNESGHALVGNPTGVGDAPTLELALWPPSPNPARGGVSLRYALAREGGVAITIHDAQGRLVRSVLDGIQPAGESVAQWDLRDARGTRVAGGLYWVRLEAEGRQIVRRVIALR